MMMDDDDEPPYMKLTRVHENGRVIWKKESKGKINKNQLNKLKSIGSKMAKRQTTEDKLIWLYIMFDRYKRSVGRLMGKKSSPPIVVLIERAKFLRDSFEQFKTTKFLDIRKRLVIHYTDEISRDAGGLIRDWLANLVELLLSKETGLFVRANTSEVAYTINIQSENACPNHLEYFYFCGQIVAKALYEKIPIKAFLAKFILKQLTNEKLTWDDLKYYDKDLWQSIKYISSNSIDEDLGATFEVSYRNSITNMITQVPLKPDGGNISVIDSNKEEYIDLYYKYYLTKSISHQLTEFFFGFFSLIPGSIISVLDFEELEFFLCGEQEISLDD